MHYADLIADDQDLLARSFVVPDDTPANVPGSLRTRV